MRVLHKFNQNNPNEVSFFCGEQYVAHGEYQDGEFVLLVGDDLKSFSNAIQAFCYLRSLHEVKTPVSQEIIDLVEKPARALDNMAKYKSASFLSGVTKEVMFAY